MRSFWHFFLSRSHVPLKTWVRGHTGNHSDLLASPAWRTLYVAAVFETDRDRATQRIAEAKKALTVRGRELFRTTGDHVREQHAIDEAFVDLHALEQCMVHTPEGGERGG